MRTGVVALLLWLCACPPAPAQTQGELNAQAAGDHEEADRELNRVYRQILARLAAAERSRLGAAQRAWLRFRRAECEFEALSVRGGSAQPMIRSRCLEKLTRARIENLREMTLDCAEGDLSCLSIGN